MYCLLFEHMDWYEIAGIVVVVLLIIGTIGSAF